MNIKTVSISYFKWLIFVRETFNPELKLIFIFQKYHFQFTSRNRGCPPTHAFRNFRPNFQKRSKFQTHRLRRKFSIYLEKRIFSWNFTIKTEIENLERQSFIYCNGYPPTIKMFHERWFRNSTLQFRRQKMFKYWKV